MSRSSKRKGRPVVPRDPATYQPKVQQVIANLAEAGGAWESTHSNRDLVVMVAGLRLLFLDRLLDHVLAPKGIQFVDTSTRPSDGHSIMIGGGLVMNRLGLGTRPDVRPRSEGMSVTDVSVFPTRPFRLWWERDEAVRHGHTGHTRRFLVTEMANTDQLHFDHELDADYQTLSHAVPNMAYTWKGETFPMDGVAEASLRQIAWETVATLQPILAARS